MSRIYGLVMQAINSRIGNKTDAAGSSGSVHAKLAELRDGVQAGYSKALTASANLKVSADTERITSSAQYVLKKEIIVLGTGTIRVSFDIRRQVAGSPTYGRIYRNGGAVGTERSSSATSYVTYTEDVAVVAGDKVQLWVKDTDLTNNYCRNFRAAWNESAIALNVSRATLD